MWRFGSKEITGPSPRARGRRPPAAVRLSSRGTIPARAGETSPSPEGGPRCRDHPRARGGDSTTSEGTTRSPGPSPRARGRRHAGQALPGGPGTIPARAGETSSQIRARPPPRDHPRARGGDSRARSARVWYPGPSPRARGRLYPPAAVPSNNGTIPARAGETPVVWGRPCGPRDHPRARGGDRSQRLLSGPVQGPSPRARGRRADRVVRRGVAGTIPARAGETSPACDTTLPGRDHPRARGGDPAAQDVEPRLAGPSPRARGRRDGDGDGADRVGTIPARAGETDGVCVWPGAFRDHPRARGGDLAEQAMRVADAGPSPRARGRPPGPLPCVSGGGTIPARAGETWGWPPMRPT